MYWSHFPGEFTLTKAQYLTFLQGLDITTHYKMRNFYSMNVVLFCSFNDFFLVTQFWKDIQ